MLPFASLVVIWVRRNVRSSKMYVASESLPYFIDIGPSHLGTSYIMLVEWPLITSLYAALVLKLFM